MDTSHDDDSGFSSSLVVHGNNNITAGRDVNMGRAAPPPPDHRHAIECLQCGGMTWRATQHCVHCGYDIAAWLDQVAAESRRALHKSRLKKMAMYCSGAAVAAFALAGLFSGLDNAFLLGLGTVFGFAALKAVEQMLH